ncbi:Uncharacterised protein (plasmid) [Klebsiella aerogenes]|nr:Uncharacterised protein [Klebsiella aerogenes]
MRIFSSAFFPLGIEETQNIGVMGVKVNRAGSLTRSQLVGV